MKQVDDWRGVELDGADHNGLPKAAEEMVSHSLCKEDGVSPPTVKKKGLKAMETLKDVRVDSDQTEVLPQGVGFKSQKRTQVKSKADDRGPCRGGADAPAQDVSNFIGLQVRTSDIPK